VPSIRCTLSTGQTFFEPATDCKQFACADATGDPPGCGVRFFSALPQSLPDGAESSPSRAPTLSPPPSSLESFQASSCRLRSSRSPPTAAPARLHAALADLGLVPPRRWALTAIPAAAVCVLSRLPSARSSEAEYGVWLSQPTPPVSRPRLTRGKPGRYGRVAKKTHLCRRSRGGIGTAGDMFFLQRRIKARCRGWRRWRRSRRRGLRYRPRDGIA
jgi:hypothetical protein